MSKHTSMSRNRHLALLISIYASLCSILALQLAITLSAMHAQLRSTSTAIEVSLRPGTNGITESDLRSNKDIKAVEARIQARAKVKAATHGAPTRDHQDRSR